ncbi:MAG: Ig-like domain-containing protein, partial [Gaiellales bacterium]
MGGWLNSAGAKVAVGAVAVVAVGAVGVVAYGYSTKASFGAVSPLAGTSVRSPTPDISVRVSNVAHLGRYTLRVDGRDLTTASSVAGGAIRLTGAHLPDGRHTVSVTAKGDGTFGGSLNRSWTFLVDTHAPKLRLRALPTGWVRDQTLAISGHTQPGARVTAAAHAATAHATAAADGAFALSLTVSDGTIPLVVTATDAAGNRRTVNANVKVDATAPAVTFGLSDVVRSSRPQLKVDVSDTA